MTTRQETLAALRAHLPGAEEERPIDGPLVFEVWHDQNFDRFCGAIRPRIASGRPWLTRDMPATV